VLGVTLWLWGIWGLLLGAPLIAIVKVIATTSKRSSQFVNCLGVYYVRYRTDDGMHKP